MNASGWVCPRCSNVYAPSVQGCDRCNGAAGCPVPNVPRPPEPVRYPPGTVILEEGPEVIDWSRLRAIATTIKDAKRPEVNGSVTFYAETNPGSFVRDFLEGFAAIERASRIVSPECGGLADHGEPSCMGCVGDFAHGE